MKPDQIQTEHGRTYKPAVYTESNASGYSPIGDLVLVLPDLAIEKSAGGVIIPEMTQDRQGNAAESGTFIEAGEGAFVWAADRARKFAGAAPEAGDRVLFRRYSGSVYKGDDGQTYRIMSDDNIQGIRREKQEGK